MAPISSVIASRQFRVRRQSVKYTDQRSKTLLEVLGITNIVAESQKAHEDDFRRYASGQVFLL